MIDKRYIETAINIRKEFLSVSGELEKMSTDLEMVKNKLENAVTKLEDISSNISDYHSKDDIQNDVINELMILENEGRRIEKLYNPLNEKMEELQKEEETLYNKIKTKYKNLSDIQIINIIKTELTKAGVI